MSLVTLVARRREGAPLLWGLRLSLNRHDQSPLLLRTLWVFCKERTYVRRLPLRGERLSLNDLKVLPKLIRTRSQADIIATVCLTATGR